MRSDPPCRPLLVLIVLCIASVASAQVKRFGQSAASGKSAAVLVPGDLPLLHTTQLLPLGTGNSIDAPGDAAAQSALVLQELKDVLGHYNLPLAAVVKVNLAAKNPAALATLQKTVAAAFGDEPPAVTALVSDLAEADALVALDAVAALPAGAADAVRFAKIPPLAQPENHVGVLPVGRRIYISGQAESGELLVAARKTMESLARTLEFLNLTPAAIVQVKAFVNPMARAGEVRQEIARFFDKLPVPPIVTIDWKFETPIEIEVIAWGGAAGTAGGNPSEASAAEKKAADPLEFITPPSMKSSPVFSRVVRINRGPIIYVGGLYGSAGTSPDEQITSIFEQLRGILESAGGDLRHLAKATYLCTEPKTIKSLGALRPNYYDPERPPAASLSMISHTGVADTTITLDMIAVPKPNGP